MKKLIVSMMMALCLWLPLGAMAADDEEITIRVMGVGEHSKDSVMQVIQLPAAVREQAKQHDDEAQREQAGERNMEVERMQMETESREQMLEQFQETNQGSTPKN